MNQISDTGLKSGRQSWNEIANNSIDSIYAELCWYGHRLSTWNVTYRKRKMLPRPYHAHTYPRSFVRWGKDTSTINFVLVEALVIFYAVYRIYTVLRLSPNGGVHAT